MEFLLVVILIIGWVQLSNRVNGLEKRIDGLLKQGIVPSIPRPIPLATDISAIPAPDNSNLWNNDAQEDSVIGKFVDWVKQDFMVKLGSFLLLLALGWFVSYAFANNWIGPVGRISLGILVGVLFLVFGTLRMRQFVHQGGIFTVMGATTVLLTLFAAREIYDFFTPESVLVLMFLTVVFVAFVSVQFNSERLARVGLLMGGLAPLLTGAAIPEAMVIFSYLLVLVAGTLWVVWRTGWTSLTLVALIVSYLHSLPFLFGAIGERDVALMFSFLLVGIFFAANVISLVRRHKEVKHLNIHAITALGTAIFLFSWIETAAVTEWKSLLYVAWALVFALGTYVVFMATANYRAFYLYGGTSIALLGVATASEFEGQVLVLMYLLEISILVIAASRLQMKTDILAKISWLLIIPVAHSFESLESWRWEGILNQHFTVLVLSAIALMSVGLLLREKNEESKSEFVRITASLLLSGSLFYIMSLVWLINHKLFDYDLGTMLSLIVYTIAGISLFIAGKTKDLKGLRIIGGFLIGSVITRLLLVEVWQMETEGRIVTFLIIGLLLISTAFIRKAKLDNNGQV